MDAEERQPTPTPFAQEWRSYGGDPILNPVGAAGGMGAVLKLTIALDVKPKAFFAATIQ